MQPQRLLRQSKDYKMGDIANRIHDTLRPTQTHSFCVKMGAKGNNCQQLEVCFLIIEHLYLDEKQCHY